MNIFKTFAAAVLLGSAPAYAIAADQQISVHVLNLQNGLPVPGITVTLEKQESGQWKLLNTGKTDGQGRVQAMYPANKTMEHGTYRVTFQTGAWFQSHKTETFFPEIPVIIKADGSVEHIHIPLLLSAYGYSTYRGN